MPRVRWCPPVLCLLGLIFWIDSALADCWYDYRMHEEGEEVTTAEPCLNCTCSRGALLCYLRVCPRLPNPPPPGCILLHRYKLCCPELICSEVLNGGNSLEARSEPEGYDIMTYKDILDNACIANGSIYGPGSAMDSSSFCEYCYCLGGKQTCVKPKCLLPIEGCTPIYEATNCCPVHYNCTHVTPTTSTTINPQEIVKKQGGCVVDGVYYKEGGKVLGVGHSACDNCYCLRGILRCEPLSCAPPLLGCTPVVRPGECCAASYNCSGTIEIEPEPNYGQYPTVSKQYAQTSKKFPTKATTRQYTVTENVPYYVLPDSPKSTTKMQRSPTEHYYSTIKPRSSTFRTMNSITTRDYKESEKLRSTDYLGLSDETILDIVGSLLDNKSRKVETKIDTTTDFTETTTSLTTESDTTPYDTTTWLTTDETDASTTNFPVTILNSTDCIEGNNTLEKRQDVDIIEYTTVIPVDANEINKLEETTTTRIRLHQKTPLEIEAILNITKTKDQDYEYDYNEPTLPPSLPNLRIIPFVAADALDSRKENAIYPGERVTDSSFGYTNRFSPPVETEGGFVPKRPPILDNFYENAVTAPSITNRPNLHEVCTLEGKEILHGQSVPSNSACVTCTCFYGNIVCQKATCSAPRPGCRKSSVQDLTLCCPHYVCDDEEALPEDTLNPPDTSIPEGLKPPDPFRNVIKTEVAPDLESLIVDMMPVLARKTTPLTTPLKPSTIKPPQNQTEPNNDLSLDKVLELLFASNHQETATKDVQIFTPQTADTTTEAASSTTKEANSVFTTTEISETRENLNEKESNSVDSPVGILKLAGCNIYGRMYRVGRIISELSNPCLECKCTDIGVQCRALKC